MNRADRTSIFVSVGSILATVILWLIQIKYPHISKSLLDPALKISLFAAIMLGVYVGYDTLWRRYWRTSVRLGPALLAVIFVAGASGYFGLHFSSLLIGLDRNLNPSDTAETRDFGDQLIQTGRELYDFLGERFRQQQLVQSSPDTEASRLQFREEGIRFNEETELLAEQRFSAAVYSEIARLHYFEVETPSILSLSRFSVSSVSRYLSTMGGLLKTGKVEVAVKESRDPRFLWRLMN